MNALKILVKTEERVAILKAATSVTVRLDSKEGIVMKVSDRHWRFIEVAGKQKLLAVESSQDGGITPYSSFRSVKMNINL